MGLVEKESTDEEAEKPTHIDNLRVFSFSRYFTVNDSR